MYFSDEHMMSLYIYTPLSMPYTYTHPESSVLLATFSFLMPGRSGASSDLQPEICANIAAAASGVLTMERAMTLRSVNRAFRGTIASRLLEMRPVLCSTMERRVLNVYAQWMVLACSEIMNSAAKAHTRLNAAVALSGEDGAQGGKKQTQQTGRLWTPHTKMSVYIQICQGFDAVDELAQDMPSELRGFVDECKAHKLLSTERKDELLHANVLDPKQGCALDYFTIEALAQESCKTCHGVEAHKRKIKRMWEEFVVSLSLILKEICEEKGFNSDVMRKTFEFALRHHADKGAALCMSMCFVDSNLGTPY